VGLVFGHGCAFFGPGMQSLMVRVSYNQKPYRRALMEAFEHP